MSWIPAPGCAATDGSSRCSAITSLPCVGIHGGCAARLTPGAANVGAGAGVVVVVVVVRGRLCGAVVVGTVLGGTVVVVGSSAVTCSRGPSPAGASSSARSTGRGGRRDRRGGRRRTGEQDSRHEGSENRARRPAGRRGRSAESQLAPEHAQPDRQSAEAGLLVEVQRALVVDLRVDERVACAAQTHPAQAVVEQRETQPGSLRTRMDGESLDVPGALGPAEQAVARDRFATVDPEVRTGRRAGGLVEPELVEPPELVERGRVDLEDGRPVGRSAAPGPAGRSGRGGPGSVKSCERRWRRPRISKPQSTSGRLGPGARAFVMTSR